MNELRRRVAAITAETMRLTRGAFSKQRNR